MRTSSLLLVCPAPSAVADGAAEVEEQYLVTSPLLAPHARFYVREMRIKAYSQLLESYRSLTMERMCRSFGVSENFMDRWESSAWQILTTRDLSRFIASGRLLCTIDKVNGIITTNKLSSENKTAAYEQVIKQGDLLLNGESSIGHGLTLRNPEVAPCGRVEAR